MNVYTQKRSTHDVAVLSLDAANIFGVCERVVCTPVPLSGSLDTSQHQVTPIAFVKGYDTGLTVNYDQL